MGRGGAGWGNTRTRPEFKKKISYPLKTRLLNFNPVPLGAGRGGYPKKPAPLPSLNPYSPFPSFLFSFFFHFFLFFFFLFLFPYQTHIPHFHANNTHGL